MSDLNGSEVPDNNQNLLNSVIIWGIAAFVLSILMVSFNNSSMVINASIWLKIAAVIVGAPLGLVGALLGDAIRKFAAPDMYFTTGGMGQLIWLRIFWSIGPQSIGLLIGVALGCSLILS